MLYDLHEEDQPRELVDLIQNDSLKDHILSNDEATFHIHCKINRHNCHIWSNKKATEFNDWNRDSLKVDVWLGMTYYFAEAMITGTIYLDMLQSFLNPTSSGWYSRHCRLSAGWSTMSLYPKCPGIPQQLFSILVDWVWRTYTLGGTFSRFNPIRLFCLGFHKIRSASQKHSRYTRSSKSY
jgi:hypothetical protein